MSNLKPIIEESMEKYKAKGVINFVFNGCDVIMEERPFTIAEKGLGWDEFPIYDLMSGEEFLNDVDAGFLLIMMVLLQKYL